MKTIILLLFVLINFSASAQNNHVKRKPYSLAHCLPAIDIPEIKLEKPVADIQKAPNSFAVSIFTDISPDKDGVWTTLANGDKLWRLKISSVDAAALFLSLVDFSLEPGARFYVYDDDKCIHLHMHTSKDNRSIKTLRSSTIKGEILNIEYYEPKHCKKNRNFRIDRVAYVH